MLSWNFRDQLEEHTAKSTLSRLLVSFSRDVQPEGSPRYVQDNIRLYASDVVKLLDKGAVVYVCGDATNMARDVAQAFTDIYAKEKGKLLMKDVRKTSS